jgi:hypothetical protein
MRHGSSWSKLIQKGRSFAFIPKIAKLRFLLGLAAIDAAMTQWYDAARDSQADESLVSARAEAFRDLICTALDHNNPGYWQAGMTWTPENLHRARLFQKQAWYAGVISPSKDTSTALNMIKRALELLPDDLTIQKEHAAIQKLAGVGP